MLLVTKSTGCTAHSSTEPARIPAGPPLGSMQRSLTLTGFLLWHVKMSANVWVSVKLQIIQEPNLPCCTKEQSVIALYAPTSFLTWALLTCWVADWIVQKESIEGAAAVEQGRQYYTNVRKCVINHHHHSKKTGVSK